MDRVLKHGGAWIIFSHGRPEDRLEHLENDDNSSIEFLSFECNVHAVPKPLVDIYGTPDLKDPDELYFVYVCIKNPSKSKQKDDKKNRGIAAKQGKKALAKRLREIRQKQSEFGAFAKTPTRDAFGNPRDSDRRIPKVEVEEDYNGEVGAGLERKEGEGKEGEGKEGEGKEGEGKEGEGKEGEGGDGKEGGGEGKEGKISPTKGKISPTKG
jgi:hypothetical protein